MPYVKKDKVRTETGQPKAPKVIVLPAQIFDQVLAFIEASNFTMKLLNKQNCNAEGINHVDRDY